MREAYDVVVVGGGAAGVVAAIQAARAGCSTLLVEKNGILGGTTVTCGVTIPGLFHAWGRQVIAGIPWEVVGKAVAVAGGTMPDFANFKRPHWELQIPVDKALYACVLDETLVAAGAEILFHAMPAAVERRGEGWRLSLCLKEGLAEIGAKMVLDCTGDANAVRLAGYVVERNESAQPGTLIYTVSGYDVATLDLAGIEAACQNEIAAGRLRFSDFSRKERPVEHFLQNHGFNAMHITDIRADSSEGKTQAELLARQSVLRVYRFLTSQPGLGSLKIDIFSMECGIRETVTIKGMKKVTGRDYAEGRVWDDSLCNSFYPIDIHRENGDGVEIIPLREGVVPTIPLGALIPENSHGFLTAGRCACGDKEAHSAFRVQASCMAMGQVIGAAAAVCLRRNVEPASAPLNEIRELLRVHAAIVP